MLLKLSVNLKSSQSATFSQYKIWNLLESVFYKISLVQSLDKIGFGFPRGYYQRLFRSLREDLHELSECPFCEEEDTYQKEES